MYKVKYLPLAQNDLKNYLVFYVVAEHEVEIHRILYAKMNIEKFIR
ncbi:hypothetical protein P378_14575 [Desulforamulus profundi]|uniref:Plasmid stabilization protein n=1 Tax=Desulforamulus profundi TaxID=1383067 RepID=A0A2C6MDN3_9FIRM|nr:hypothetical protein P378_14575 [Desulforamulus profundi]